MAWETTADDKKSEILHANNDFSFGLACDKGHLDTAQWLWAICPDQEQSTMLHASNDWAFRVACGKGHIEITKWLWIICSDQERSAMLRARDRGAFRAACQNGYIEAAKWLWIICSDQERSTMLHAQDDYAFGVACEKGHLEIAKWLWGLCKIPEEQLAMLHARYNIAFLSACKNGHIETAKWLWSLCPQGEQSEMLHAEDDYAFGSACQKGHIEIAKWLLGSCQTAEEKTAMLHANVDYAFCVVCQNGHLETANWLWSICPELEQSVMLHARYDYAFRWACAHGHQEIAQWLWGLCQTAKDRSAMLHAKDDRAFREACKNGHLEITKWLFSLHQNDLDTRLKLIGRAMTIKDGIGYVLWPCLNVIEQLQMLSQGFVKDLLKKAIANNDAKDFNCVIQLVHKCHDALKRQYNDHVYQYAFLTIIDDLVSSTSHQAMYLEYIKGCKAHDGQLFRKHQMDYLLRSAIKTKDHDKINTVLSALDAEDLLASASFLEGWLTLAVQEGVTGFVTCYQKALWCDGLYPLLQQGKEHINDGMITIIRTLFETKACSMTSLISVINQHVSDPQYWPSICQQVIIDMIKTKGLNEDTKALFESLCQHALAPENYFSEEDYHEMKSQLMSWYEEEVQRTDQSKGLWKDKQSFSKMYGRLGIGLGITTNLATGKVAIDQNLTALDQNLTLKPRSVAEFPSFSDDNNIDRDTKRLREEQGPVNVGKRCKH